MRFGSLLFAAAAVLYFSSKVLAGEAMPLSAGAESDEQIQYLPTPLNPKLTPYGEKAAAHLADSLGISLKVEEKEALAHAEKMAIRSTATASTAQVTLFPNYLYCLKGGISVGFSFDGATCVDGSGTKKSVGIIGLGGLEAQGHATVIVVYSAPGESINGLYSDAKGTSLGLILGGSGIKFGKKRDLPSWERKAGYANLYSFGLGLGISRFSGANMTITDSK